MRVHFILKRILISEVPFPIIQSKAHGVFSTLSFFSFSVYFTGQFAVDTPLRTRVALLVDPVVALEAGILGALRLVVAGVAESDTGLAKVVFLLEVVPLVALYAVLEVVLSHFCLPEQLFGFFLHV